MLKLKTDVLALNATMLETGRVKLNGPVERAKDLS